MLRPLKLNDNLNNMTLFFTFPNDFYKTDGETLFTTNNNNQIYSIYSNNIYRIYSNFNNNLVKLYEITRDNLNDGSGANININELKLDDIDDIIVELNSNVSFNNYINIDDGKAKYTIIVDKQPRDNPSSDKKEITLILEHPLLKRGDINDELIIQNGKCIISRKLELTNDNNIKVLDEPYEEIIENINLDLFLGDNYIYILEENYMPLYIKYLTHNDLNTAYATKLELTSSITQTSTNIMLEVRKKTDKDEIISTINQSAEKIQIQSNKISLEGYTTINDGFSVDLNGSMSCNNATINGGKLSLYDNGINSTSPSIKIQNSKNNSSSELYGNFLRFINSSSTIFSTLLNNRFSLMDNNVGNGIIMTTEGDVNGRPYIQLSDGSFNFTTVGSAQIRTPELIQTSLESSKKNFEKLENGLDILKEIDIYKYNLKSDNDNQKKHIGFVIGNDYKYREEITSENNDGVDLYSMISVAYKAIQEQQKLIDDLQIKLNELEVKLNG